MKAEALYAGIRTAVEITSPLRRSDRPPVKLYTSTKHGHWLQWWYGYPEAPVEGVRSRADFNGSGISVLARDVACGVRCLTFSYSTSVWSGSDKSDTYSERRSRASRRRNRAAPLGILVDRLRESGLTIFSVFLRR